MALNQLYGRWPKGSNLSTLTAIRPSANILSQLIPAAGFTKSNEMGFYDRRTEAAESA